MSLPGKLCVGILQEDNPLRSYFRFKPLLVEENGRYVPFGEADQYPDEGCIRIVPDKNESYYFKSRMRLNGLFSVVDLRDHPNDNDKIRPNKNYRHGGDEINAYIIYSDVVRGPAADMIYQLLPAEALQGQTDRPHTPRVLVRQGEGISPALYDWTEAEDGEGKAVLRATEAVCAIGDLQVFETPGFGGETLSFVIKPAALMASVCEPIERAASRAEAVHAAPDRHGAEKPAARPAPEGNAAEKAAARPAPEGNAAEKPASEGPAADAASTEKAPAESPSAEKPLTEKLPTEGPAAEGDAPAKPEGASPSIQRPAPEGIAAGKLAPEGRGSAAADAEKREGARAEAARPVRGEAEPAPRADRAQPEAPAALRPAAARPAAHPPTERQRPAERPRRPQDRPAPEAGAPDKPWIHRDAHMLPPPVDPRLSRSEQLLAAQAGLNPRRGRSLQELIDEKWQYSRLNQLGTPASPIATGAPVKNPVDAAVDAVRAAWVNPNTRQELLNALTHVDAFSEQLAKRREIALQSAEAQQLNALEAQRLELLAELDRLKEGGRQIREQLKEEIRRDEAEALSEAVEKTRAAQAERQRFEDLANDARQAAKDAQGALDGLVGDQLERTIRDVALTRRVQERLELLDGDGVRVAPAPEKLGINAFIDRVARRIEALGWGWSREEVANLCVCLVLSPVLLISGGPGSGKTAVARLLADALGASGAGRSAVCPPEKGPLRCDPAVKALLRLPESPATVILDDANLAPHRDVLRGMAQAVGPEWRIVATLQDLHSGYPLSAGALDKGFMVRLNGAPSAPWKPPLSEALPQEALVSIDAIRASMPRAEVPEALIARVDKLRGDMAACGATVSRRALNDAWRYCSTMMALLGKNADIDVLFDRVVAQRLLPVTLASAPIEAALRLRELAQSLPLSGAWLKQQIPVSL